MNDSELKLVKEELKRKQTEIWDPYDSYPTPELFHFTPREGFVGIIEHNELWCTDIRQVKDSREGDNGLSVVQSVVRRKSVYKAFKEFVLDSSDLFGMKKGWTSYITCFCSTQLSHMWQDYAAEGTGCALVFDYGALIDRASGRYALIRMLYNREMQVRQIEATLDHAKNFERELEIPGRDRDTYWTEVQFALLTCAIRFKEPQWCKEQEVRLWVSERPEVPPFEACGKQRVKVDVAPTTLKRAIRGPAAGENLSIERITRLLRDNGFTTVPVVEASV